jgi:hypothetical protein
MAITLDGTSGITTPDITSTAGFDSADLTGDVAAARITNALNATGSAPIYACRAWVNFDGTGTPAIRASGNVSSITDNGTGDYTVNFTTAMPDANYNVVSISTDIQLAGLGSVGIFTLTAPSTTTVRVASVNSSNNYYDCSQMHFSIFR